MMRSRRFPAVLLVLACGSAIASAGTPSWEARVDEITRSDGFATGHWGLLVVEADSGRPIFERNPDALFCPASVTKLFSTAAALHDLGADYRFKTPVVRRGEVVDGVLRGDLILVAKGDLCLGGRTGPDGTLLFEDNDHSYAGANPDATLVPCDPLAGLTHLARAVQAAGIRAISGDVLVDDRLFEPASSTGSGPSRVSPIVINDNVVDILITPGSRVGDPAWVRLVPETATVSQDARVETVGDGKPSVEVHAVGPGRFAVRGKVPLGHRPVVKTYEVEDAAAFARGLFIETLRGRGVRVDASPLALGVDAHRGLPSRAEVARLPVVAEYTSPPLGEYLRVILKVSQNLHASTLPLLIAANHGEGTLARGLRREGEILTRLGVDPRAVSFGGGAGGSRSDLASPRATVSLLKAMTARPDFATYQAALPVLGRDGTLAKAVGQDSPARGHARAKTGTYWVENSLDGRSIMASKALAGYLETAAGKKLIFAFYVNNVPVEAIGGTVYEASGIAGKKLGKLCELFYDDMAESANHDK
jgi:D-alanyl-D-alanine carboxypeptidase/D-alanyl-D-alanine-endopeptidase (penicillin-binding protein 4)